MQGWCWAIVLLMAINCGAFLSNVKGSQEIQTTQDIREENLEAIKELEGDKFNNINLKEIETLLSTDADNYSLKTAVKTAHAEKNSNKKQKIHPTLEKQGKTSVKDATPQVKTIKTKTNNTVDQNSHADTGKESAKKILDSIIRRMMSQHHRGALGKSRVHAISGLVKTKKAGNQKNETLHLDNSNVKKITEKSETSSKVKTKVGNNIGKAQGHRDLVVFSRLEAIAHNVLRVLKHRENSSKGSKQHYRINRDDLLKIRDFIKTTRDSKIERKVKVRSAKDALVAIKNLLKLIKRNRLGQAKSVESNHNIGKDFEAANSIDSNAFAKSRVQKEKNVPESQDISSKNTMKPSSKYDKKYYLQKLKELRIKVLKDKLLKVLKLRDGESLNADLKRIKSKLQNQVKRSKREEKQDEEPVKQDDGQEKPVKKPKKLIEKQQKSDKKHNTQGKPEKQGNLEKQKDRNKEQPLLKKETGLKKNTDQTRKASKEICKQYRSTIEKKIKNLNKIMKKQASAVKQGIKRFQLAHGAKSFRKNLISLANLDANKMTDEDLKKLHDKINEWIEVEEKLERETENGEAKDEISSGINQASDLLSSLQLTGENGKKTHQSMGGVENYEKENSKKNRNLEITIDINRHGKKGDPKVSFGNGKNVDEEEADKSTDDEDDNNRQTNTAVANKGYPLGINPSINKVNDRVENVETVSGNNQASSMYGDNGNPAVTNGNPAVTNGNPAVTNGNPAVTNGNPAVTNGNPAVTNGNPVMANGNPQQAGPNDGNPQLAGTNTAASNPMGNKYLREMAKAYMDGKAIRENKNFGEKLRKLEENFENNVNNLDNNNKDVNSNKENVENFNPNNQNDYSTFNNNNFATGNANELKPGNVGDFSTKNAHLDKPRVGNENSNAYEMNRQNHLNEDQNVNRNEQFQRMSNGNSLGNNKASDSNSQENLITSDVGNVGNYVSKNENSNRMNSNTGKTTSNSEVGKEGPVADEGHVANEGHVADAAQVPNEGKGITEGILPNGRVITNVADFSNEQTKHVDNDIPIKQSHENLKNAAANQLANTMNQDDPNIVTNVASNTLHGTTSDIKSYTTKSVHLAKKPKVTNPDYDDPDYDYTEADEDDENMSKQKQPSNDKTPFLQSDRLNKPTRQRNPQFGPRQNYIQQYTSQEQNKGNGGTFKLNANQNTPNGRPGKNFYRVGKPLLRERGRLNNDYRKLATRLKSPRNRQRVKMLDSQPLNKNAFRGLKHGNGQRISNINHQSTGQYYSNRAARVNSAHVPELSHHFHPVQPFLGNGNNGHLHVHSLHAGHSMQQRRTPKSTHESNDDETEQENEDVHGDVLNGKEMEYNGKELQHVRTDEAELQYQNENGMKLGARVETGEKTLEEDNQGDTPQGENTSEEDPPNSTGENVDDSGIKSPENLHGKALLNNFLDEEGKTEAHSSQNVPQSSKMIPQVQHNPENTDETESTDELDDEDTGDGDSNTSPHNSQVLSAETDGTEPSETFSDDENSDVPQFSAKLIDADDEDTQSNPDDDPTMQETIHRHRHLHLKKARHRFSLRSKNRKHAVRYDTKHRHNKHKSKIRLLMKAKHTKQIQDINHLQQLVNKKFTKQKTFSTLQRNTKPTVNRKQNTVINIANADAFIRGAMRSIPSKVIHIAKTQPESKPLAQKSAANAVPSANDTAGSDGLISIMPKLKKVQMKLNLLDKNETLSPQEAKFIEKQAPSKDQQSNSGVSSSGGAGGVGGGGVGGGLGGLETSGISFPSSQVATQSLLGEDKVSNLNANDVMSSSSEVDRIASSSDPTDLTQYEHKVDIAERTGAGDIVPVGVGGSSPSVTPVPSNTAGITSTGNAGVPPEHVLLSPNSAKGDDLLKPLANDPDGKLAALQDLRALTGVEKEQEASATQDTEKISDPAFLEGMSNRISVSGTPLDTTEMIHTASMPLRDIDQPESTLMVPGEKLKRDEKGSSPGHKNSLHDKNAQFTVDNKIVALGSEKPGSSPTTTQLNSISKVQQLADMTPESRLATKVLQAEKPTDGRHASEQGAALSSPQQISGLSNNLPPKITELIKNIVKESLDNEHASSKEKATTASRQSKASDEIFDDSGKEGGLLLKSEKMETKPYETPTSLKNSGGIGKGSQVSPQSHNSADSSKTSLFLPNVPVNPEGDHVLFGGEPKPTDNAGTMDILSKSNLSREEKIKLIKAYQDSQKTPEASIRNNPSKTESPPAQHEVDESKITELLKTGKFSEQDLKSDFAGKEAAMQDMMMLEKQRDLDDKLSQAHLLATQASKAKGPGSELPPGSQRENAMSLPGNLSPDITLPGNVSPGASLPETLPAEISPPANGLPENTLPGTESHVKMPGFEAQYPANRPSGFSKEDPSMMAKETQMDKLLEQAQEGMPKDISGKSNAAFGLPQLRKVPISEEFHTGLHDELRSIDNTMEPKQPNYDAVDTKSIGKFIDTVQGLSPAEVKAYGIDVNNDVYIDKSARQRPAAQRSLHEGYTTIGAETGRDFRSFANMRKSHVNRKS